MGRMSEPHLHTCAGFGVLPGAGALYGGLSGLWSLSPPLLQITPLVHSDLEQPVIGSNHRILEALTVPAGCPSHRELHRCRRRRRRAQSGSHVLGLILAGVAEHHQEFIAPDPHYGFLRPNVAHEETGHLHQHAVSLGMTIPVIVLLEVIDIEIDAAPLSIWLRFALACDRVQIPAVVTASEWVPDAELEKLGLQLLALRDVDENTVTVLIASLRIDREKCAVDDRPHLSIATRELELDVANGAIALELRHLSRSYLGPDEIARAKTPQLFQRFDAKHFEEGGIRIDDLAIQCRDVDSFLQA